MESLRSRKEDQCANYGKILDANNQDNESGISSVEHALFLALVAPIWLKFVEAALLIATYHIKLSFDFQ